MILDPPLDVAHCSRRSLRQHSVLHAHARARIEQKRELRIRSRHGRYSSYPHSRAAVHTHAAATFDAFEAYILRLQKNIIQVPAIRPQNAWLISNYSHVAVPCIYGKVCCKFLLMLISESIRRDLCSCYQSISALSLRRSFPRVDISATGFLIRNPV
jgi:hypothetical protein